MMRHMLTTGLVLALALVLAGCKMPGQPNQPEPASEFANFTHLYRTHCSGCHGKDGTLGPAPPLNNALFLSSVPDAELLRVITEGRPLPKEPGQVGPTGTLMPPFASTKGGPLTEEQVKVLATGLKSFWGPEPKLIGVPAYLGDGKAGSAQAGVGVYDRACARCHGKEGAGGVDVDVGKKIGAINDRTYLALISDQALRRIIITGRPDLGMPSYEKTLGSASQARTAQDIADLVALLAAWRQGKSVAK